MEKRWQKGDQVQWATPHGRTTGVVHKVVTGEVRVRGTTLVGSADDPVYIVKSAAPGKLTGHRKVALKRRS